MSETITVGGLDIRIENRRVGEDGGLSMKVMAEVEGAQVQLLRFDIFDKKPHYHYAPDGVNIHYDLDPLTCEDGVAWVMTQLHGKLPAMISKAGYEALAGKVDHQAVVAALPDIEKQWRALG